MRAYLQNFNWNFNSHKSWKGEQRVKIRDKSKKVIKELWQTFQWENFLLGINLKTENFRCGVEKKDGISVSKYLFEREKD